MAFCTPANWKAARPAATRLVPAHKFLVGRIEPDSSSAATSTLEIASDRQRTDAQ
jgi:hypothetical protein